MSQKHELIEFARMETYRKKAIRLESVKWGEIFQFLETSGSHVLDDIMLMISEMSRELEEPRREIEKSLKEMEKTEKEIEKNRREMEKMSSEVDKMKRRLKLQSQLTKKSSSRALRLSKKPEKRLEEVRMPVEEQNMNSENLSGLTSLVLVDSVGPARMSPSFVMIGALLLMSALPSASAEDFDGRVPGNADLDMGNPIPIPVNPVDSIAVLPELEPSSDVPVQAVDQLPAEDPTLAASTPGDPILASQLSGNPAEMQGNITEVWSIAESENNTQDHSSQNFEQAFDEGVMSSFSEMAAPRDFVRAWSIEE